jgi:release factor glutamine methyltransferase
MAVSIIQLHKSIVLKLKALYGAEEVCAMSDRLFEYYLHLSPTQRVLAGVTVVDSDLITAIDDAVQKLLSNIPLQYVLGTAFFMDLKFAVNPSVLIPRPETEEMVDLIIKQYAAMHVGQKLNILDIGTGSGCIAIALKRFLPASVISAIDISEEALKVAAYNASKNNATVNFIHTDILDKTQWNELAHFDLIVSNPPYVTHEEKIQMLPNVLDHEPHTALFVPDDDPLIFYRTIIDFSKFKLRKAGVLWFEINEKFGGELKDIAMNQGFTEANIIFDFRGKSRFLQCLK